MSGAPAFEPVTNAAEKGFAEATEAEPRATGHATEEADAFARKPGLRSGRELLELLLVGGLTPLLFPLSWLLRRTFGLDGPELAVGFLFFHAAFVVNDPHFAVSYLLFYEDVRGRALGESFPPALRLRYVLVGFVAPALLLAWCAWALATGSAIALGYLLQLMFLLVGWHYVKQGFGLLTVLSARRGVRYLPRERAILLAHCYAGWAYAWASPADPGTLVEEKGVVFRTIARSRGLEHLTGGVLLATVPPLVWMLWKKRRREGALPVLTPLVALLASIWAWSIYAGIDPLVRYLVPALHSVQYLYIVWMLKASQAREREKEPWFEQAAHVRLGILVASSLALGFVLFHGAPTVLDAMLGRAGTSRTDLGPTPYLAAVVAFVNIHHYLLDTVIWRRENPLTRYLAAR